MAAVLLKRFLQFKCINSVFFLRFLSLQVILCLVVAMFASGLVHRVCVTTWWVALSYYRIAFFRCSVSWCTMQKTVRGKIGEKCSKGKQENACGLRKGCFSMPGYAIPSDWSILTSFVNSWVFLMEMRNAICGQCILKNVVDRPTQNGLWHLYICCSHFSLSSFVCFKFVYEGHLHVILCY